MDGHLSSLGWSPTNPRMVTHLPRQPVTHLPRQPPSRTSRLVVKGDLNRPIHKSQFKEYFKDLFILLNEKKKNFFCCSNDFFNIKILFSSILKFLKYSNLSHCQAHPKLNSISTQTKAEVSLISSFRQASQPPFKAVIELSKSYFKDNFKDHLKTT